MADKTEGQGSLGGSVGPQPQAPKVCLQRASYADLKKELQQTELALVNGAQLSDEQLKIIQDRLYRMIEYTVERHDWYVDQCHRLLQIGLALIATGGAIGAIFGKIENLPRITPYFAWGFALSLFVTGLSLVYWYNRYLAGDHPYRKVVDIHSWYFAYRFPQELNPNLSASLEIGRRQQVAQEAKYIEEYFAKFLGHAKDRLNLIREDIEQVAILLILQRYRHQQTKKMHKWLFGGLRWAITPAFLGLILTALLLPSPKQPSAGAATVSAPTTSPAAPPPPATAPTTASPTPINPVPTKPAPPRPTQKRPNPANQPRGSGLF
jgi:hypothetical protein